MKMLKYDQINNKIILIGYNEFAFNRTNNSKLVSFSLLRFGLFTLVAILNILSTGADGGSILPLL